MFLFPSYKLGWIGSILLPLGLPLVLILSFRLLGGRAGSGPAGSFAPS